MEQPQSSSTPTVTAGDVNKRELTLAEIIARTWNIFSERLQLIGLIALVIFLPLNLIAAFLGVSADPAESLNGGYWVSLTVTSVLSILVGVLAPIAITHAVRRHLDGQPIDFRTAIRFAFSKWGEAIITALLLAAFLIGLTFLLIVPAIILGIYWAFATNVIALKGRYGMAALRYSKEVVQGRWWKVCGYLVVLGLISGLITWLISLPFVNVDAPVVTALVSTLSDIVFSFTLVGTAILFINLDSVRRTSPAST